MKTKPVTPCTIISKTYILKSNKYALFFHFLNRMKIVLFTSNNTFNDFDMQISNRTKFTSAKKVSACIRVRPQEDNWILEV